MLKSGKIDEEYFKQVILPKSGFHRNEVKVGPSFGVDVAVIELNAIMSMALTSDPLSLIPSLGLEESAWLSVHLLANDIATTSLMPLYLQTVLNLPPTISDKQFREYWRHIDRYCKEIGVAITGGHTGVIKGQNSTISGGGTMITIGPKDSILVSKNAQSGDAIIMTKQCAMSSVAILAMCFPETVENKLGKEVAELAKGLFYQTSVLKEAKVINQINQTERAVNAMHDVTEGGVLGAVFEMAVASNLGVLIDDSMLNKTEVEQKVCGLFNIDPRYCIGAGSMIMAVKQGFEPLVLVKLRENNIEATVIGKFVEKGNGRKLIEQGGIFDLPYFETDPYWAAFFEAFKNGWK
ncbi:AIR synthase family protein [Emticicia sp.]|uniref:AIR synthase family protein n=1 Tax=Emticicia sp. TaxID=1930953 RepID=UPI0037510575